MNDLINHEKEDWKEFLEWLDTNKDNLPDWIDTQMSVHQCRILWKERIKNDNQ